MKNRPVNSIVTLIEIIVADPDRYEQIVESLSMLAPCEEHEFHMKLIRRIAVAINSAPLPGHAAKLRELLSKLFDDDGGD